LGGPNFTHLPINAPKCPFATFQQDGHMAMMNVQLLPLGTSVVP
jgi:catalase